MFEKIFVPKRNELSRKFRILHIKEICYLRKSLRPVSIVKSGCLCWARYMAQILRQVIHVESVGKSLKNLKDERITL
jgi:hypothetical protein